MSREELAERAGTNPQYLSRLETGRENPTLDLVLHLITGLEVKSHERFQFEHGGERPQRWRRRLERLVAEVKEEELARMVRVLEALVH